jgi:hypothetical protein
VIVLVTIGTPHVGPLKILSRLAYNTDRRFLIINLKEEKQRKIWKIQS